MHQENTFSLKDVHELIPGLNAFPEDVFAPEQPWLAKHFLPLLSIDLGILRPDLAGQVVHMLNPIEPFEGYIGDNTLEYHNEYTAPNWLAFKLTPDNRFLFLGNENYFLNAPANAEKLTSGDLKYLQKMQSSYIQAKQAHAQGKGLKHAYLDELGGEFWYGNWAGHPPIPSAFVFNCDDNSYDDQPNDGISITHQGHPFFPVACVSGYNWCAYGADSILMFYEPVNRIVLYTFDWT